ncbi:MAG: murein hydrolase activator EnvC family protein [Opitutales bacterium]|jgi:hypothetical protein
MIRLAQIIPLLALIGTGATLVAGAPQWPVRDGEPGDLQYIAAFVQPTVSGEPESALFGCVRTDGRRFHEGLDIAPVRPRKRGEATDPVVAVDDGIVRHISTVSGNSSYGRYVVVEHAYSDLVYYSLYSHLATVEGRLSPGQVIRSGERIGIMGRSAGGYTIPQERSHLHLELGLRLSDQFQDWYRRQSFDSPNEHGNFNGMNLSGWNPLDYFQAMRSGRVRSPLEYVGQIPPAVMLHIYTDRVPDFNTRYPELVLEGCAEETRAGWEILLSGWGLPVAIKPIDRATLKGVLNEGDISVVGVNRIELDRYECRRIISEKNGEVSLGRGGRDIVELLFMPSLGGK